MAQDRNSYLDLVKRRKPGRFETISKPVSPAYEITALVVKLEREAERRPLLLFGNVKDTNLPVLTNLHAGRPRLAAAVNAAPEDTQRAVEAAPAAILLPGQGRRHGARGPGWMSVQPPSGSGGRPGHLRGGPNSAERGLPDGVQTRHARTGRRTASGGRTG